MTLKELASLIAGKEGKKKEAHVGNVREIVSILSDLLASKEYGGEVLRLLVNNGVRRAKKREKK